MANQAVPDFSETTSLQTTDLMYLAKKKSQGGYVNRRIATATLKSFVNTSTTEEKEGSYTITAGECDKRWFSNNGAVVSVTFYLPVAVDGYQVGIMLEENQTVFIAPDSGDKILPTGVSDGVSIQSSVVGSSVYLRGYVDGWHIVYEVGTWTT